MPAAALPRVKEPHLVGRWYPCDPSALAERVRSLLDAAGPARRGAAGLVVPHAALDVSGPVAAAGFAAAGRPTRVVLIGPSHHATFEGACLLPVRGYRTPLGVVPVDEAAVSMVGAARGVRANPAVFMREQSIEAQLPFLQVVAPEASIVPVLVGTLSPDGVADVAAALRPLLDRTTLVVVSSDMVHYGRRFGFLPEPAIDASAVSALLGRIDGDVLAALCARDGAGFRRVLGESGAPVCGSQALEVLLDLLPASARGEVLAQATSLDAGGHVDPAFGYAAVAFGELAP